MEGEVLVTSYVGRDRVRSVTARDGKPQASPKPQDRFIRDYFVNSVLLRTTFRAV